MQKRIAFDELLTADLTVGAVYEGGTRGNAADDPLARLLPVGNQGGFRFTGRPKLNEYRLAVLYTSGAEADWPDVLDPETGAFTYFGDNRRPGNELHATRRGGNQLLRFAFDALHGAPSHRDLVPPFFIFSKMAGDGRAVEFAGLAVPGAKDVTPTGDLVAVWRTTAGQRFQNYRATFTVLDCASVPRAWIEEVLAGDALGAHCPSVFRAWVQKATYTPLESPRTTEIRTIDDQRPQGDDAALVAAVYEYFEDGYAFELCAMELWRMLAKDSVSQMSGTRAVVDGGRDAVGLYSLGPAGDRVHLDFSLEAKRYAPTSSCGVKDLARLISRLRHRQFGVFVTTSYVGKQAYTELREDRHPVVVICGRDIAAILKEHGYATPAAVTAWLSAQFPPSVSPAP